MKKNYFPGLDGLRAVAVIAIIIYHLNPQWLPGGFLGVDTFFIISGYLITSILLNEKNTTGKIDLVKFYIKRLRRLLPAVIFMICCVFQYCLMFEQSILYQLKKDMLAALLYVSNWYYIFDGLDYFQSFEMRPLKHLWSLAIEEQFYLFFPLSLILLGKFFKKKGIIITYLVISILSLLLMMFLFDPAENIARIYFGTDTRLQSMLLGVILAFIWVPFKLKSDIPWTYRFAIDLVGIPSFIILLLGFFYVSETTPMLFEGGLYYLGFITLFIIASSIVNKGILATFLSNRLFVQIGKYSYSLYLWHYPIIAIVSHHFVQGQMPVYAYMLCIILTILMAIISFHVIEEPFRKYSFKKLTNVKQRKNIFTLALALYLVVSTPFFYANADAKAPETAHKKTTTANPKQAKKTVADPKKAKDKAEKEKLAKEQSKAKEDAKNKDAKDKTDKEKSSKEKTQSEKYADIINKYQVLMIGDSVLVDIESWVREKYPNAYIDGEIGRSIYKAIPVASGYQRFNNKNSVVVLEVGTNGDFQDYHLKELVKMFDKANVYLVTTRVPRSYEGHVNQLMKEAAKKYKNVHLIDWYAASAGHVEYFAPDGIHLEAPGSEAMTELINTEIGKSLSK
ncbi:acyltransferase family protein [Macrococcus sp. DPC7161]|uniref:acyltransferase family protein n=1 Tax=Macrococcus sp. DPC7161 TaxID=2507060 RepID=UPI00100B288C|nr:acyltransferase family protein [Macrococcus sp. DPC7161]RXK18920.1 acyltransferase [Macrococcus sp. DPC7161]